MSKSKRADEDEYRPARSVKKRKSDQFKLAQQQVSLKDLIKAGLLTVGQRIYVKDQEAEITEEGTIKVFATGNQFHEYPNPTSWTRQATGRESGGWQQIRLKPSNELLSTVKEKYLQNLMEGGYESSSAQSVEEDLPVEDVNLPLNVRFACDETRPFKISWVSPDYQEFHFEYQNKTYMSLAEFGQKIYEDMQSSNPPTNANFSFNSLVYEVEGKWVKADKILETEKSNNRNSTSNNNNDSSKSSNSNDNDNDNNNSVTHNNNNNNNNSNNSNSNSNSTPSHNGNPSTPSPSNTPTQNHSSANTPSPGKPENDSAQFKILLVVEEEDAVPVRVNAAASTMQELLTLLVEESGLGLPDPNSYDIKLWDEEFGLYTRFPKQISQVPNKCRVSIRKLAKPTKAENATNGSREARAHVDESISAASTNTVISSPTPVIPNSTPVHNDSVDEVPAHNADTTTAAKPEATISDNADVVSITTGEANANESAGHTQ